MTIKQKSTPADNKPVSKLPSSWQLFKKTLVDLKTSWRPLSGVTAVYAALYFLFVMGLSFTSFIQSQVTTDGSTLTNAFSNIFGSISGTYGSSQSDATVLIQYVLFIIASLALIWTLRKLQASKKVTIRDAYYQGSAGIIPVILITVILALCLLPAVLGSTILGIALQATGSSLEIAISVVITGLLLFVSLYLFVMYWPAFYIASLPLTRPMQALRSAKLLTKKRRLSILRKLVILALSIVIIMFVVLLPCALILPAVTPYIAYITLFIVFAYMHIYLYQLYRSLL